MNNYSKSILKYILDIPICLYIQESKIKRDFIARKITQNYVNYANTVIIVGLFHLDSIKFS
jgi:hypothetical protein